MTGMQELNHSEKGFRCSVNSADVGESGRMMTGGALSRSSVSITSGALPSAFSASRGDLRRWMVIAIGKPSSVSSFSKSLSANPVSGREHFILVEMDVEKYLSRSSAFLSGCTLPRVASTNEEPSLVCREKVLPILLIVLELV